MNNCSSCLSAQLNEQRLDGRYFANQLESVLHEELGKYSNGSSFSSHLSSSGAFDLYRNQMSKHEPPVTMQQLQYDDLPSETSFIGHPQKQQHPYYADDSKVSPLTVMSTSMLERVYNQETWRMYNRIQKARQQDLKTNHKQSSQPFPQTLESAIQCMAAVNESEEDNGFFFYDHEQQQDNNLEEVDNDFEEEIFELDL